MGIVGPERIDEINILQATYEAMRQAIAKLDPAPQILLNDAVTIPQVAIPQVPIIKGRCEERFHRGGKHPRKGHQGPHDGRV